MTESEFNTRLDSMVKMQGDALGMDLSYPGPETAMPKKEFEARKHSIFEAAYKASGIDLSFPSPDVEVSPQMHALATKHATKQIKIELERDPLFKAAWLYEQTMEQIQRWATLRRPTGAYRLDGVLTVSENRHVFMPKATRDGLLSWALCEKDERNLEYIKSCLELWDDHPDCKTLAELEKATS
jgi:hypothetical protein